MQKVADMFNLSAPLPKATQPGAQRLCLPDETLARVLPLRAAFGVTRLATVTGLDRLGIPVVIAMRPNARSIAVSQGKGATLAHAKVSALMEAVEIWHAEHFAPPLYYASRVDLAARHDLIDLEALPHTPAGALPGTMRQHWVTAQDILGDRICLVPWEMVHADYTEPRSAEAGHYPASTNGLASGNHPVEAICHGICEVVERDALALWHARPVDGQRASQVDLATVTDPSLRRTLGRIETAGLGCTVWDVSCDTQVPSFMAVIHEDGPAAHLGLGSGSHPDPVVALHRTLNEAAQTRLNYISGARDDLFEAEYTVAGRAAKHAGLAELLDHTGGARPFGAAGGASHATLNEDLHWLMARLQGAGVRQIAVVDLTDPRFDIPVVRVIIPGLEAPHDDAAYVPGSRVRSQWQAA
ncbi:YcaO-like family protein [uncultured Roseobacter sp.]|uniref:YcaO-like family protein n=1 Tax=uncultured Roseobacter sp. TaxID=114847 RepID=UPI00260261E5|nr:YcaO-like family protein [uncultured Roseobacter sp.]